jgi:hypothetical protein
MWEVEEIKSEMYKPTDTEIVDYVVAHQDLFNQAVRYGMNLRKDIGALPSPAAALYFLTYRIDAAMALEFWASVLSGEGLRAGDPEHALRAAIIRRDKQGGEKPAKPFLAMCAKAWNARREGKKIKMLSPKPLGELTNDSFKLA